jgi:hypothetical protein
MLDKNIPGTSLQCVKVSQVERDERVSSVDEMLIRFKLAIQCKKSDKIVVVDHSPPESDNNEGFCKF